MTPRPSDTRGALPAALTLLACFAVVVIVGCSKQREVELSTGRVIDGTALPGVRGDDRYSEVRADALPELHAIYADTLSHLGLVKWDERADCNHLADLYVAAAQTRFAALAWHSETPAQALALAVAWYRPTPTTAHAIVEVRTERGALYVDPQRGAQPMALTQAQQATIYFRKW